MSGPPPKSYELRIAEGNPAHRPIPEDRVKTPDSSPVRRKWLDKYGKEAWNFLIADLVPMGIVSRCDSQTLAAYCEACSKWRHLNDLVKKEGYTITTAKGTRIHPACSEATKLFGVIRGYQSELALSASARTRLRTNEPPKKRKQGDLLAGPKAKVVD